MFWERGRCDRGASCHFYHDPAIKQNDARQVEAAQRDAELELTMQLAHAAALLGRRNACKNALARAEELQKAADAAQDDAWNTPAASSADDRDELRYGTGLHAGFRRGELRREAERIGEYLNTMLPKADKSEKKRRRRRRAKPSLRRGWMRTFAAASFLEQAFNRRRRK